MPVFGHTITIQRHILTENIQAFCKKKRRKITAKTHKDINLIFKKKNQQFDLLFTHIFILVIFNNS